MAVPLGYWIWTPETGRWENPKYASKDTPHDQFDWAMGFYTAGEYKRAGIEFRKLINQYPSSSFAAEAQYYIGLSYVGMEKFYEAYKAYQKTIEKYPFSKRVPEIVKREYKIGELFLKGKKMKFLGMSIVPTTERAIEIFKDIVESTPYGEYAPRAQYNIGLCYKKLGRFSEAREEFQKVVNNYPENKLCKKASYEAARCLYKSVKGPSYDQQKTGEAEEVFKDLAEKWPDSKEAKEAHRIAEDLSRKKAESVFKIAKFYELQKKPKSAAIYYREVIDKYPSTEWKELAKERLKDMGMIEEETPALEQEGSK